MHEHYDHRDSKYNAIVYRDFLAVLSRIEAMLYHPGKVNGHVFWNLYCGEHGEKNTYTLITMANPALNM